MVLKFVIVILLTLLTTQVANGISHLVVVENPIKFVKYGETAKLVWKSDLDETTSIHLIRLFKDYVAGIDQLWNDLYPSKMEKLEKYFGGRAYVTESRTQGSKNLNVTVIIKNIQPNDTFTFFLRAYIEDSNTLTSKGYINSTIRLQPTGLRQVGEQLKTQYTFNEGEKPMFNIALIASPTLRIRWTLGGKDITNLSTKTLVDPEWNQYNCTIKLNSLTPADCGKELTYEATNGGFNETKISGKTVIQALFHPPVVDGIEYHEETLNNTSCRMINWNGSTAGNCTNAVQYIAEIITVTKRMVLNVTGNNSLQLCNTTEVIAVSIGASYKGRHGEKSKFYLLERCSRDVLSRYTSSVGIEHIAFALGGFVAAIILETAIVLLVRSKKNHPEKTKRQKESSYEINYQAPTTNLPPNNQMQVEDYMSLTETFQKECQYVDLLRTKQQNEEYANV